MNKETGNFTAIISGASGLVGEQLLKQLLDHQAYSKVIAVVRKPLAIVNEKLEQRVIDFGQLSAVLSGLKADHGFCCLGTTIKTAGSKEKQYVIDHDYVVAFALGCHSAGISRFAVVSSIGASPGSSNFYLRTKGEMERDVQKIPFGGTFILRPSFLVGERREHRAGEKIAIAVMKVLNPMMGGPLKRYRGVNVLTVAKCMVNMILSDLQGTRFVPSDEIM
ncbi:MAG: oxidoreductase [Bacteroidota bacterium]